MFSLFPLLLVLVSVLGYLPIVEKAPQRVINFITQAIPISRTLISDTLSQVLENRSASGLIGLIGLAWSASGVFTTLARNINRAWPRAKMMNFWESRIIALIIIGLLGILLIATVLVNTLTSILPGINWRLQLNLPLINSAALFSEIVSWVMAFLVFTSLYRWVPTTHVRWRNALWGAAAATLAWEIASKTIHLLPLQWPGDLHPAVRLVRDHRGPADLDLSQFVYHPDRRAYQLGDRKQAQTTN